jgi:hypothetical protein
MDAFQQVPGPRPYPRTVTILASQSLSTNHPLMPLSGSAHLKVRVPVVIARRRSVALSTP